MPRDWQSLVQSDSFSNVMRLVHLAMRMDQVDEERVKGNLLQSRRRAYEDELTCQSRRCGCPGRSGNLGNGDILSGLNAESEADAASIVNTYNYDLAVQIMQIRQDAPTANRHVYAHRLQEWHGKRAEWKNPQITEHTESTARAKAQQDFYTHNGSIGMAELEPKTAVCPVCQGWIARGEVPIQVAMNHPPPYHPNCPHYWRTKPLDRSQQAGDCDLLWMGE